MTALDLAAQLYLVLAALGLAVPVAYAGMPVLGQGAFVAVGGFGVLLLERAGLPLVVAGIAAVALAALLGAVVAASAARLSGAPLALATWALAWLAATALVAFPALGGGSQGLVREAPAQLVSPALGVTVTLHPEVHVVFAGLLCALGVCLLARMDRGPLGLDLAALREGPLVASSLGVGVRARRQAALAVAAAIGALAGAGTTVLQGVIAPADVGPLLSLQLFVAVLIGGTARAWGPVLGVGVLALLPPVADALASAAALPAERARGALTALLLVAVLLLRGPAGRVVARLPRSRSRTVTPALRAPKTTAAGARTSASGPTVLLAAREIVASYGALTVLHGIDLDLRAGEVHALVGPNGSGKSTLLRVLAGALPPAAGTVTVAGRPAGRGQLGQVRLGVARTFQRSVVLPRLSPARQVAVGAGTATASPGAGLRHLLATPAARRRAALSERLITGALATTGLLDNADADPRSLVVADQRLLQIARVLATGAQVLLLDEPAAGTAAPDRDRLAGVLRGLAGNGAAVLLVEHDMRLVTRVADRVTVLAAGRVLAVGSPAQVLADEAVRRAYLGTAQPAETR